MRKLASIKLIADIQPIAGKDRIVLATVDGWHVIVRKDEYNIGDKCVYVEIDSVLPEKPEFEFLRSKNFRIKTMKMGHVVSQGICFPLSILPPGEYSCDQDVTDIIGVKQYSPTMDTDPVVPMAPCRTKRPHWLMRFRWFRNMVLPKRISTDFPDFISKTDETRIQNIPFILPSNEVWVATEKIDGQSGTFALVKKKSKWPLARAKWDFIVCSRNRRLPVRDSSSYWKLADKYHIRETLEQMARDLNWDWVAIQGECIGPKIQGNKYQVSDADLYVFNIISPHGRLGSLEGKRIAERYKLKFVPIIDEAVLLPKTVDEVLTYAHGKSQLCDIFREGIVFRTLDGSQSFKAVDPLFLIQYGE